MAEKFIRYGKLRPVKQKGFNSHGNISYHSPPKGKGFYAFPFDFEEMFLVANLHYQSKVQQSLPTITKWDIGRYTDRDGVEVIYNDDYETKDVWAQKRVFEIKDSAKTIWHHLEETVKDKSQILDSHGSWVKTTIAVWKKALNKSTNKEKMITWREMKSDNPKEPLSLKQLSRNGYYSIDKYEVFFEYKV